MSRWGLRAHWATLDGTPACRRVPVGSSGGGSAAQITTNPQAVTCKVCIQRHSFRDQEGGTRQFYVVPSAGTS